MSTTVRCRIKPYIQPFERRLAMVELFAVAGTNPVQDPENSEWYHVTTTATPQALAATLAYWESVEADAILPTTQVLREATVNVVRNGLPLRDIRNQLPFGATVPVPNRRCLRYGTHGIHEYRGKFFPQLVRSLINAGQVPEGGLVVDPMSGSGTTAVESVLAGRVALAADINPLSVLMSRTKCQLLGEDPEVLAARYEAIRDRLLQSSTDTVGRPLSYFATLPARDQQYLTGWFSEQVLTDLDQVAQAVQTVPEPAVKNFMLLALSNTLRRVSWQKEADLRVRREVRLDVELDPVKEFLEELGRSVRTVLAFLYQNYGARLGSFEIVEGSAREAARFWAQWRGQVDAVITSPPYATALPYLDTDRLSLSYLGLLPRPEHRSRDLLMIGNREITEKQRVEYWAGFQRARASLPDSVVKLVEGIETLNAKSGAGFRRRNLPALLAKYFLDMREVLRGMTALLKPGAPAYIVIGNNHTVAGDQRIDIETATLLAELAETVGLIPREHLPMEMLTSRDIFKKNAVASEVILIVQKPAS